MKIIKENCARCHRPFDFELYNGLCPHCGCFHRSPGVSMNVGSTDLSEKTKVVLDAESVEAKYKQHLKEDREHGIGHNDHKDSMTDPHERQMRKDVEKKVTDVFVDTIGDRNVRAKEKPAKKTPVPNVPGKKQQKTSQKSMAITLCVVIIIASLLSSIKDGSLKDLMDLFSESMEDEYAGTLNIQSVQGEDIVDGDYYFITEDAYEVCDADAAKELGVTIPEETKVIAVWCTERYDGPEISDDEKSYPYVYDGSDYWECLDDEDSKKVAAGYDIGESLFDKAAAYSGDDPSTGYLLFTVSKSCDSVTVCFDVRENGKIARSYEIQAPLKK